MHVATPGLALLGLLMQLGETGVQACSPTHEDVSIAMQACYPMRR